MDEGYEPIDCTDYDKLEALATTRRTVRVRYRGDDDATAEAKGRIVDLYAQDGVEYARLNSGESIRLDRLETVDAMHESKDTTGGER